MQVKSSNQSRLIGKTFVYQREIDKSNKISGIFNLSEILWVQGCGACQDVFSKEKAKSLHLQLAFPTKRKKAQSLVNLFEFGANVFFTWVCCSSLLTESPKQLLVLNGTRRRRRLQ